MPSRAELSGLVRTHQAGVWAYLRVLGCEPSLAEDLTQETFLVVMDKPFTDYAHAATAAFLRTTARNLYLTHVRGERRREALLMANAADTIWGRLAPDETGDAYRRALDACFETLGAQARELLERHYRDGAALRDMAAERALTESNVKTLMHRAREQLRACIARRMTDE